MNVGDKLLTVVIERAQEMRLFPVTAVNADPSEAYPLGAGMSNNLKRKLGFSLKSDIVRYSGSAATIPVVGPLFRKVESSVDQCCGCIFDKRCKYGDLTVVNLAETTAPLTSSSDGLLTFFGDAGLIQNQTGIRTPPKKAITIFSHLIHHWTVLPW